MEAITRLQEIIKKVELPEGYNIECGISDPWGGLWFEITLIRPDTYDHHLDVGHGGQKFVSPGATDGQIVRAIGGAFFAYIEHEGREAFKYEGKRIFGPHISIDALLKVAEEVE